MDKKQDWTQPEPMWRKDADLPGFPALDKAEHTEVLIVGGGITGITTAYLLAKSGKEVTLLESDQLLNGTTGHTTAKVTAQHGLIYEELVHHFGLEKATLYYQAQLHAHTLIERLIHDLEIDCNWTKEDAYLYSETEEGAQKLEKEYNAYQTLGIPGDLVDALPFNQDISKALMMSHQARFHPIKYLTALVNEITQLGGKIYEGTEALKVKEGEQLLVTTNRGAAVTCDQLVSCTHFPFYDGKGFYFSRMHAERSYLLAIEPERPAPGGMYLSIDEPKRSIRTAEHEGRTVLLIGGESHPTGEGRDTRFHYRALEEFAAETFGVKNVLYHWSAQDLTTLDKVPYIGPITRKNDRVFIATGFRKWGMTNGTLAAQLNHDYIMGEKSLFHEVFKPARFKADPSIKQFLAQNFDVSAHLVEGKLELVGNRPEALKKGEGGIIQWRGERAGAYKDEEGRLHVLDTTCTHMGCEVEWNSAEHTWDCPCHGSRFSFDGAVMEGPAKQPLLKIALSDTKKVDFIPAETEEINESSSDQP